jgi:hypothetical protein
MERAVADGGLSPPFYVDGIEYRVATRADEPVVRELLARISTGGDVRLSFRREPDAFGAGFSARAEDFIVARDRRSGALVGLCERVVRDCFVDGATIALPYLAGLRVAPDFRHRLAVLRGGFEAVRRLPGRSGEARWSFTSIMADNAVARRVLGANLAGMPRYEPVGEYSTFALPAGGNAKRHAGVDTACDADLSGIAALLLAAGARGQFAAAWPEDALRRFAGAGWLRAPDYLLVRRDGRVRSCAALWDQSAHRQVVVAGYSKRLARVRPLVNLAARWTGLPRLPAPGGQLRCAYLSHVAIDPDSPQDLVALVGAARARARERGIDVVLTGWASTSPQAATARAMPRGREYRSTIYVVRWPDEPAPALDGRPLAPEIALL